CCWLLIFFFFSSRRRHTRFSRDWSSDVCSSDLKPRNDRRYVRNGVKSVIACGWTRLHIEVTAPRGDGGSGGPADDRARLRRGEAAVAVQPHAPRRGGSSRRPAISSGPACPPGRSIGR